MRALSPAQPTATLEQRIGPLPTEGKPHLSFNQCLMVAKQHTLGGMKAAELASIYGYTEKGMEKLLQGPYMQALMGKLYEEWSSGAEQAAAIWDAGLPTIARRVMQRAMPLEHKGGDEWEAQKFMLSLKMPKTADQPVAPPAPQADPVVINQLFVGLREFKSQLGSDLAGDLSQRLLHGTEGIDLAEPTPVPTGPGVSAPTPVQPSSAEQEGAPGEPAPV